MTAPSPRLITVIASRWRETSFSICRSDVDRAPLVVEAGQHLDQLAQEEVVRGEQEVEQVPASRVRWRRSSRSRRRASATATAPSPPRRAPLDSSPRPSSRPARPPRSPGRPAREPAPACPRPAAVRPAAARASPSPGRAAGPRRAQPAEHEDHHQRRGERRLDASAAQEANHGSSTTLNRTASTIGMKRSRAA